MTNIGKDMKEVEALALFVSGNTQLHSCSGNNLRVPYKVKQTYRMASSCSCIPRSMSDAVQTKT